MEFFRSKSSESGIRSGHNASPDCLPNTSSSPATAGKEMYVYSEPASDSRMRPIKSSLESLAPIIRMRPPGFWRGTITSRHHSQHCAFSTSEKLSCKLSSFIAKAKPCPLTEPAVEMARSEPPCCVLNLATLVESGDSLTLVKGYLSSSIRCLLTRVCVVARSAEWEDRIIGSSGCLPSHHALNN